MHWRDRTVYWRSVAVSGLVRGSQYCPIIQLVLSRTEEPLAPSYPTSLEGWSVGCKKVPALPFLYVPTLDIIVTLPDLAQMQPSDANKTADPFLILRFAVNIERAGLILFDLNHYISDPNIF